MKSVEVDFRRVLAELRKHGILLESDKRLPSVTRLVAGGPIHGSWWAHPRGHEIHQIARRLASHPDVTVTKLVSKKVTFVHRSLWPALVTVVSAPQTWQAKGLSRTAQSLLTLVNRAGRLRTDRILKKGNMKGKAIGDAARELETRLLVHSVEVHTESGAHAKQMESWKVWTNRSRVGGKTMSYELAERKFEVVLRDLNRRYGAKGKLPWQ